MLWCKRCKKNADVIEPVISKLPGDRYTINAMCSLCNKPINRSLNKRQIKLLPKSMIDSNDYSIFKDYKDQKTGGIIPLLPLLGPIFAGVTEASGVAGTVANSVIQSKKNEELARHNKEVDRVARGEGLQECEGGFIGILPLITAIVAAAKSTEYKNEKHGGLLPVVPLISAIYAASKAIELPDIKTKGGKGTPSGRSLNDIVNNVDSMTDGEKRDVMKVFGGLGYAII
jgi:hypothetical protein